MIKIIIDSCCDTYNELLKENSSYCIEYVPIGVSVDNVDYLDDFSKDNTEYRTKFLNSLNNCEGIPRTFAPSPDAFFTAIDNNECDTVFIICVSSKLSGTYSSAILAKQIYDDDHGDKNIFVINSYRGMSGETAILTKLIEYINENLDPNEIYKRITKYAMDDVRTYLILKSLKNLERNGRVSPSIAKLATLMSLRPICAVNNGTLELVNKPRGDRAYKKMIDIIKNDDVNFSERTLIITHVNNPEAANMIKVEVEKTVDFKNIVIIDNPTCLTINYSELGGLSISY